jgi:iron complex outermembrane receptor protein
LLNSIGIISSRAKVKPVAQTIGWLLSNYGMMKTTTLKFIFPYIIISLFLLGLSLSAFSQQNTAPGEEGKIILRGKLLEEANQQPLAYASVSIFKNQDSSRVNATFTQENGDFQFALAPGIYFLHFQYLGFQELVRSNVVLNKGQEPRDLGSILMKAGDYSLETVNIEVERSQMQLTIDKRIFNVGTDLTGAGNSAADILNNVPSVTVDPEGNVSLRGSQSVRILVDGKPSAMLSAGDIDALRRMQGDIIESVEVITNPSARYEAEGEAGIINIILKKNKKKGVNGSFGATAGYPQNFGGSYSLNYRQENLNFFSNFGLSYRKTPGGGNSTQRFYDQAGSLSEYYSTQTDRLRGGLGGNLQLGTDWFINENNVLTGSLLYRQSRNNNHTTVVYDDFDENENLLNSILRNSAELSNNRNVEAALNYKKTFEQEDREWTVDFKYILDDDLELTDYEEAGSLIPSALQQRSSNTEYETNLLFQTDYIHPINDSTKIEGGLRTTLRTIKNRFLVEQLNESGEFYTLPQFDDELLYNEDISAAYVIGSTQWRKLGLQAGLRGELSDVTAALLKSETENKQFYFNLFPSVSTSYQFSATNQLQASYSRRLSRPYFRLLLPFSNFSNPRNNSIGNPTLRPEYTDSYELSFLHYLKRGSFLSSVYYRRTTGVIERLILPAGDGTTIRYPVNLSERNAYGLELNYTYDFTDWWNLNTDLNFYRATIEGSFEEVAYNAEIFSWRGRATSQMVVSNNVELQMSFDYQAPRNNTQGRTLAVYALDIGASLDVLEGQGTFTLSGRDLFNTRRERRIIDQPDYQAESVFQWRQSRQAVLSFVYRLNQDERGRTRP